MKMKAALFRTVNAPVTVESVEIDQPSGREVLVRTVATGVCHSDLHMVDGSIPAPAAIANRLIVAELMERFPLKS